MKHCQLLRRHHAAAVIIQSRYRQFQSYSSYQLMLLERVPAATTIQRHRRGFVQRQRYAVVIDAVIVLQSFTRGAVLVRNGWIRPWREGAICIQRIWRGFQVQLQYQMYLLDVILVQCTVRRNQGAKLAKRRFSAVSVVQRMSRGWVARMLLGKLRVETGAAIMIQVRFCIFISS
jgi:myosin heavy subunit